MSYLHKIKYLYTFLACMIFTIIFRFLVIFEKKVNNEIEMTERLQEQADHLKKIAFVIENDNCR